MAKATEKIGVEAVVLGYAKFMSNLKAMGVQWDKTTGRFRQGGKFVSVPMTKLMGDIEQFQGKTQEASGSLGGLGGILGMLAPKLLGAAGGVGSLLGVLGGPAGLILAVGAGIFALGKLKGVLEGISRKLAEATQKVAEFSWSMLQAAGHTEELEIAAHGIGLQMGMSADEIDRSIQAFRDYGIRQDVAARATAQMVRYNLDLSKSLEMARIAQGAAVVATTDSSEAIDRLIYGLSALSTYAIRRAGYAVENQQIAFAKWRDEMGLGNRELNESEKRQALFASVLRNNTALVDLYTLALQSPTKALRSLQRKVWDLKSIMGRPFLQAFAKIVQVLDRFVVGLTEAVQEGGVLYPHLIAIAGVLDWVADAFSYVADILLGPVIEGEKAAAEGAGMVKGSFERAGGAAATFIEKVTEFLFGPGGLGDMVIEMGRYGFFLVAIFAEGIIKAASAVLIPALEMIGAVLRFFLGPGSPPRIAPALPEWGMNAMESFLKGMTEADFGALEKIQGPLQKVLGKTAFAKMSLDLAEVLATGRADEGFYARMAKKIGLFGEEIAELARREVALAQATETIEEAEKRAAAARALHQGLIGEYNALLREGADPSVLNAKLEQIQAAEDSAEAAEGEKAAAEKGLDALKEAATHQGKVVDQLLKMTDTVQGVSGAVKAGLGGASSALEDFAVSGAGSMEGWTRGMEDAIANARAQFEGKLAYLFEPLTTALTERIGPDLDTLGRSIHENLMVPLGLASGEYRDTFAPEVEEAQAAMGDFRRLGVEETGDALEGLAMFGIQPATDSLVTMREDGIGPVGESMLTFRTAQLIPTRKATERWAWALDLVKKKLEGIDETISGINTAPLRNLTGYSPSPLERGIRGASVAMREFQQVVRTGWTQMQSQDRIPERSAGTVTTNVTNNRWDVNVPVTAQTGGGGGDMAQFQLQLEQTLTRVLRNVR